MRVPFSMGNSASIDCKIDRGVDVQKDNLNLITIKLQGRQSFDLVHAPSPLSRWHTSSSPVGPISWS